MYINILDIQSIWMAKMRASHLMHKNNAVNNHNYRSCYLYCQVTFHGCDKAVWESPHVEML